MKIIKAICGLVGFIFMGLFISMPFGWWIPTHLRQWADKDASNAFGLAILCGVGMFVLAFLAAAFVSVADCPDIPDNKNCLP